jgi:SAM-dependent methyltransferase
VRVKRDFDRVYEAEADPWAIGDARDARYDLYRQLLLRHARGTRILDIGSGMGAFLARFVDAFDELTAVDTAHAAVERGRRRFPNIEFVHSSAERIAETALDVRRFDAILLSDVLYYLPEAERRRLLDWVNAHLDPDGVALIAAWCPGGDYLTPNEFDSLVRRSVAVLEHRELGSGHVVYVTRRKRHLVALTFDYETWQPIPQGRVIDWDRDVFAPAAALLDACDAHDVKVTLFAELGEYLWLDANEPTLALRMEEQWRDAVRRGHDVQLHLHPSWLPETGARHEQGAWHWNWDLAKADAYPGDLNELVGRCVERLERAIRPVAPGYAVTCFRAGAYQAQPFRRLHAALAANGITCDSSVYAGGVSTERGYDYRLAWSERRPYFASGWDPQLPAPPDEELLVELPVSVVDGVRVMLDGDEPDRLVERARAALERDAPPPSEMLRRRQSAGGRLGRVYAAARPLRRGVNRVVPRRAAHLVGRFGAPQRLDDDMLVAIGHTKADLRPEAVARAAATLRAEGFDFVRLSDLAAVARDELLAAQQRAAATDELDADAAHVWSRLLRDRVPLDREKALVFSRDAAAGASLARAYPWMSVDTTPDAAPYDCAVADNVLQRSADPDAALGRIFELLAEDGVLLASITSDARNPDSLFAPHVWKTVPHDVANRLRHAGFVGVAIDEVDTFRRHGAPPFPPSRDRLMLVRAWKRSRSFTALERAAEAMGWVHRRLDPRSASTAPDAAGVIAGGTAFCAGYAIALGGLLEREGYDVRWLAMEATGHPRGRGPRSTDTHVAIQARIDGRWMVLDAMANTVIPHSLAELLRRPELARGNPNPDERYRARGYELYDTGFWYSRVTRFQVHRSVNPKVRIWRRNPHRRPIG